MTKGFDRWRGVGHDPANPFAAFADPPVRANGHEPEPTTASQPSRFRWVKAMTACPARVRAGCGCGGVYQCRVRELARVEPEDCRRCLATRRTAAESA